MLLNWYVPEGSVGDPGLSVDHPSVESKFGDVINSELKLLDVL